MPLFRRGLFFPLLITASAICLFASLARAEEEMDFANDAFQSVYAELNEANLGISAELDAQAAESAAPWAGVPGSQAWTNAVITIVRENFSKLEQAKDKNAFCPGYASATQARKEICWLRVVGAIARYESNYHPRDSFREPNGKYSVGLMALSPGECSNAPTMNSLKDPVKNLICGTRKMAGFIARGGYISGPGNRGAAAYWSVLRAPYKYRKYRLGKKNLIIAITRQYNKF